MGIVHNDEYYYQNIRNYLIYRAHAVRVDANLNRLSLAGMSEDFYVEFLNILLDLSLENANDSDRNAPGIDLMDYENRVAVQVSVTCAPDTIRKKIRASVKRFEKPADEEWQFYFVPITDKAPELKSDFTLPEGLLFDRTRDVLDITRIMELAKGIGKLKDLYLLVEEYSTAEHLRVEQHHGRLREKLDTTHKITLFDVFTRFKKTPLRVLCAIILAVFTFLGILVFIPSREKPVPSITTRGKQENLEIVYTDLSIKEYNRGLEYYNQGKYAESERCFEDALKNAEPLSLDAAEVHISLGLSRYVLAQSSNGEKQAQLLSDALDDMVSASAIFQENGKESKVIYGLLMQGFVNKALGKIDGTSQKVAVDQYKEAYGKAKDLYGEENYYTCDICNRIASLYISDKNVDDAELWLEKALKISIREDEVVTASVIKTLNSIAYNCQELGKFRNEIGILLVTAEERYVGIDDVDEELIRLYNNLGSYYHNIVKNDKMARHYDDLYLRATSMVSGKYNYDTAVSYHNLANDFRDSNYESRDVFVRNQEEALRLYNTSLEILEKIDPKTITDSHINIDGLNMDIAEMGWLLEDINRAISWYEYNEATFGYQKLSVWNVDENGNIRLLTDDEYHAIVSGEAIVGEEVELP